MRSVSRGYSPSGPVGSGSVRGVGYTPCRPQPRRPRRNLPRSRQKGAFPRRSFRSHERHPPGVRADLPDLRARTARDHANRRVPVFLRMHAMQNAAEAEGWRLLRVLFLRIGRLSSYSRAARLLSLIRRIFSMPIPEFPPRYHASTAASFMLWSPLRSPLLLPATTLIRIPKGLSE